jgi:hypothetical protein
LINGKNTYRYRWDVCRGGRFGIPEKGFTPLLTSRACGQALALCAIAWFFSFLSISFQQHKEHPYLSF